MERNPNAKTLYFGWDKDVVPGQFIMVWIPGMKEFPMSVSHMGKEKGITVKNYGPASTELLKLMPGDRIFFRGPYGRGFTDISGKKLIIGAGSGMASLHPLIDRNTYVLIAARSREDLLFEDEVQEDHVVITTDDGSHGVKGNFLEGLKLFDLESFDMIYACGPEVMLFALYNKIKKMKVKAQLSLERMMKCGIGLCDSCSINGLQVCVDGPVFDLSQIHDMTEFGTEKLTLSGKRIKLA